MNEVFGSLSKPWRAFLLGSCAWVARAAQDTSPLPPPSHGEQTRRRQGLGPFIARRWLLPLVLLARATPTATAAPPPLSPSAASTGRVVEAKPSAEPASPLPPSARPSPFTTQPKNDWLFRSLRLWGVVAGNVVSAAATRTETRTSTAGPREAASFGIASSIDIAVASRAEGVSVRAHGRAGIGGGQAGLDGRYEVLIMAGPIYGNAFVGVAPRLGLGGGLRGNQRLFRASVALPRADLAFDWHPTRGIFVETGITGAPTLIGRSNVDETRRPTGGAWQAGFFGIVGVRWFSAVVQGTRELARSAPGSAIDTLDVHACLSPIAAVVLCPHALLSRGSAIVGGNAVDTRVRELSLTLGYGAVEAY